SEMCIRDWFLAPTGLVLVTLQMLGIQFNQWVKFVLPMVGFVLGFGALMLVVRVMICLLYPSPGPGGIT
ncbi:hypothetical protein, partial [Aeromonas salmonicida]|uniref:hypothetical protein n=1 Tax=Aeromonas salmonicida TaxID=645 RepID=UPI003D323DF6